jgi:hypothetical protein
VPFKNPTAPGIAVSYARGRWPVFVGLGTAGVVHYREEIRHRGWWYYKTLWAIAPDYDGSVVITGYQVNGPHRLRFNASDRVQQQVRRLRFDPVADASSKWRYGPSTTLIRAPGCYTFKVRGTRIGEFITFIARP